MEHGLCTVYANIHSFIIYTILYYYQNITNGLPRLLLPLYATPPASLPCLYVTAVAVLSLALTATAFPHDKVENNWLFNTGGIISTKNQKWAILEGAPINWLHTIFF